MYLRDQPWLCLLGYGANHGYVYVVICQPWLWLTGYAPTLVAYNTLAQIMLCILSDMKETLLYSEFYQTK